MLNNVMTFDIHDFKTNITESYVVLNTEDNQEKVLTHRFTRNIQFSQMFSFQFDKEMRMPIEFIEMDTWMRIVTLNPDMLAPVADLELV